MPTESVALLFTDMVDSTAHAQRLSPDQANEHRRDHFALLRQAIAANAGAEVKSLGDGIMAVFSSASAALACAVAIQQSVELANRGVDERIGVRVGLGGGEVVHEDGDYFGDPAIEAARLCAACGPGQILATEVVPLMAGRRNPVESRPYGPLTLKGIRDPVSVIEVQWEPLRPTRSQIPLPGRLTSACGAPTDFVAREQELATIADAAERAFAGQGREVVIVSGQPGQGKTTLVAEAARLAYENGACVLFGHSEDGLSTPYGLFAEALAHYATHADDESFGRLVEPYGSEWCRFVPAFLSRSPDLAPSKATDSDAERYLLFSSAGALFEKLAGDRPLVLVFDDLQWADPGSLALLRHLTAADDRSEPLLITGTLRDSEGRQSPALQETLGDLWRRRGVSRIDLAGIGTAGVESLIHAETGRDLGASGSELAELIHRETSGNPFFVTEMLHHLVGTGALPLDESDKRTASEILGGTALPTSVREYIGGRVARLGGDVGRMLGTAAVIGRDFDLDLLRRASGRSADEVLDMLDAASEASIVSEVPDRAGRYSFSHALVQRTLSDGLGRTRRSYVHACVAEALEDLPERDRDSRVGELAHHWLAAPRPASLRKALHYSHRAGSMALESLAPADAARHFETALGVCGDLGDGDPTLLVDLAIGLGTAQRQVGDPAFRETLLRAVRDAIQLDDVGRMAAACLGNDRGFYTAVGSMDKEKIEVLEQTLARLEQGHPARALVTATLCSELAHGSPLERRRALAEEAVAVAEKSGSEAVLVRVLNHVHVPLQVPPMLELTEARAVDGLLRAERIGDPVLIFWAAQWRLESAARTGNLAEVDRSFGIHGAMAELLDQPVFHWGHAFVQSLRAQIAGDVDLAERKAREALDIGTQSGQPDAALIFGGQINIVAGQRGTQPELIPLIEQMSEGTPDIPRMFFASILAKAYAEAGDLPSASKLLSEFADTGYELPMDQLWLTGMVDLAEAAIECGELTHALALFERLEPYARQLPATGGSVLGPVSYYLGGLATVLGRIDRADAYFEQSADLCRRMDAKFFAARTNVLWARMLAERGAPGDTGHAHGLLTDARATAAAKGYAGVERRAAAALAELPASP